MSSAWDSTLLGRVSILSRVCTILHDLSNISSMSVKHLTDRFFGIFKLFVFGIFSIQRAWGEIPIIEGYVSNELQKFVTKHYL